MSRTDFVIAAASCLLAGANTQTARAPSAVGIAHPFALAVAARAWAAWPRRLFEEAAGPTVRCGPLPCDLQSVGVLGEF